MRVKVTAEAFYDNRRVHVGEIISVPSGFKASWAEKVSVPTKKKAPAKKKASKKKASKKK